MGVAGVARIVVVEGVKGAVELGDVNRVEEVLE